MSAILSTLRAHGIIASIAGEHHGSAVTRYDLAIPSGTRVDAVVKLSAELAMATASQAVRIAPVPGTSFVGVEVPVARIDRPTVTPVVADDPLPSLSFHVGSGTDGQAIYADLAKLPHLLIAGQTGSGKSIALTSIVSQLMVRNSPATCQFLMADPKRVELALFAGAPHLAGPVATEVADMLKMLDYAVTEMERRYDVLQHMGVRKIGDLPALPFPYLVVVLDEIADLMLQTKGAAEGPMVRIAQLGRAAGVHLLAATQYPKADVVTSLFSANVPSRLVFAVAAHTQSQVALGESGAEKLLGQGDGLFREAGNPNIQRVLSCYVSDDYMRAAAASWKPKEVDPATYGTPDEAEPDADLEPTINTFHVMGKAEPIATRVVEHAPEVEPLPPMPGELPPLTVADVVPVYVGQAPDGTPMTAADRLCYMCNHHRAYPGASVCLTADCRIPTYEDAPVNPMAAQVAQQMPARARRRWFRKVGAR